MLLRTALHLGFPLLSACMASRGSTTEERRSSYDTNVNASNDTSGLSLDYLYRMEGDFTGWNFNYMNLSALTTSYNALSRPDFSNQSPITGHLRSFNTASNTSLSSDTIPYISCDNQEASRIIDDIFNTWSGGNNIVLVLYSTLYNFCSIAPTLKDRRGIDFFTLTSTSSAQALAMLRWNDDPDRNVTIRPNNDALPPDTNPESGRRKNSPIPMIVLYALTSTITVLLLLVIVGGAIKARRHPERYGPRTMLRPRQSRARGIAMAMLETLPIVKFGDVESKEDRLESQNDGAEMVTIAGKTEGEATSDAVPAQENPKAAVTSPTGKADKMVEPPQPTTFSSESEATRSPPGQPASESLPTSTVEAPGCSICTEDFVLGEEMRKLPCSHLFHPPCVDPWLLNVSGTCPLCRIDLRPPQDIAADERSQHPNSTFDPAMALTRPILDAHSGRLAPRSSGLEAITQASQEERIGILRRWREERRRSFQPARDPEATTVGSPTPDGAVTQDRRRSRRYSQWLRTTSYYENNGGASSRSTRPSSMVVGGLEARTPVAEITENPLSQPPNNERDAQRDRTT